MAYLRFSRDRRGYEQFALVQQNNRRGNGKSRPRLLYWFRTPPNVKVGREPFDSEARRTLEARNPDIFFDWEAIVSTPIPPVETENWRERRRAERAARQSASPEPDDLPAPETETVAPAQPAADDGPSASTEGPASLALSTPTAAAAAEPVVEGEPLKETAEEASEPAAVPTTPPMPFQERRRRRRRRRRGGRLQPGQPAGAVPAPEPVIQEVGGARAEPKELEPPDQEPTRGDEDGEV